MTQATQAPTTDPQTDAAQTVQPESDPLRRLVVIERLEVGPPRLEPALLAMPYRVVLADGRENFAELLYRYEEPVFDPEQASDQNLAAMIGAQLALNYGLFCRRIVFRGLYDASDRRFLAEMMANTAREIYVKKFLEPNPFLLPEVSELPALKRPNYVQAEIDFETDADRPAVAQAKIAGDPWRVDPERYAILSSGGKDSLLSHGLLRELGIENHSIFLNESGRHWFTALNAYRHFSANVPHTARVWTNCDRLYAFMLRNLSFVRPDFARLRADEYPIRLWTVAVFLFGALPLVRRRGLGRLLVGDEYDTTVRAQTQGIPHFDGLYDQSRLFDDALSRYFQRKGWGVTQFSILRQMSELLIEKTLAERYPDLLRLQVSCHAAHTDGDRVRPCGRCEKCRRIVGMLTGLGFDAQVCGYSEEQIAAALEKLIAGGVHQERPAAEHLAWLLHRSGRLREPRLGDVVGRERPEALGLRFHAQSAPINTVPVALRRPLYGLLLENASGAVRRVGRQWIDFDPLQGAELDSPYPFDRPVAASSVGPPSGGSSYLWAEMTWPEAERRLRTIDTALLPVGAIEQHGHHLPLDVDSFDADYLARRVASECSRPHPLVLPLIPYGVSYHHDDFKGTLSITNETLARLVYEIGMSAARNGINKLIIINGHGGNSATLHFAAQMINRDAHIFTCVDSGETSDTEIDAMAETPNDVHAGEIETSTSLANRPHLVQMSEARSSVPDFSNDYLDFSSHKSVGWYARTAKISASGVMGNPEKATAEKGERMWNVMVKNLVEMVEHLKSLSLEEIYQRRY